MTIEKPSVANDSVGQETVSWIRHTKAYAEVKALTPFQQIQAGQVYGVLGYNVTLQRSTKTTSITPDMRVVWHRGAHGDLTLNVGGPPVDLHPQRRVRLLALEVA